MKTVIQSRKLGKLVFSLNTDQAHDEFGQITLKYPDSSEAKLCVMGAHTGNPIILLCTDEYQFLTVCRNWLGVRGKHLRRHEYTLKWNSPHTYHLP